ncbi:hypothetical protein FGM00_04660 [Aggregatimonas sangjinii]|uniref:SRPBCC family protein n=1 Tax=Aggregatimonas sangjinii TaxID=2583587 RepID=A0A5B7SS02_9FLAO|nr:hypothetical protein [Aggregatimonas sangjinii]QCW99433.1 hypothetical protein FGM00_04660 [Aggregatimonas sangjinii]
MEEIVIQVNANNVWDYLGEGFGDIAVYDSNVIESIGFSPPILMNAPSDKRRAIYPENYEYIERLIQFSSESRSLAFINLRGFSFPYKKIEVSVKVISLDKNVSILRWKVDIKLTFWTFFYIKQQYSKAIRKHYRTQFAELKYYLENDKQKRSSNVSDYNFMLLFDY